MTTTDGVHVAYPEIRRSAREVLRGAGLPLALADEGAELLTWTEAALGGALACLRGNRLDRPVALAVGDGAEPVVDCRGASLLAVGVRLADFAVALARTDERDGCRLTARDVADARFLAYVVRHVAVRGVAARAVFRTAAAPHAPALIAQARRAGDGRVETVVEVRGGRDLTGALGTVELVCGEAQAADAASDAIPPIAPGAGDAGCELRVERAIAEGFDVSAPDHRAFGAIVRRLRVPTSERSRAQAG